MRSPALLPDPGDRELSAQALLPQGLDSDQARDDLPDLIWLKLVVRTDGALSATDLGAAVRYRALYEASQERLGEIARLADPHGPEGSRFAAAVRRLADGSSTFAEARRSPNGPE
ncbi:hypothetical protein [Actinacidiphila alni]|uniref:hypothetical protein n=1 Tax=Actinacidiphila alni TaxID=380248 RepID=UPI003455908D